MTLREQIAAELALGRACQAANAGRARVCARRAAGWTIRAWYQAREGPGWGGGAMKQLTRLRTDSSVPPAVRAAAVRLTTRVDHDHQVPFTENPLDDADMMIEWLLPQIDPLTG